MTGILMAVLLGWAGGYRFYKKQTGLGIFYLLTGGGFGIGWIIDIVVSIKEYSDSKKPLIMDLEIKGGWAESKMYPNTKRTEFLESIPVGSPLTLQTSFYEGAPFFLICSPAGPDIGAMPKEVNYLIRSKYPNAQISAVLLNKADPEHAVMRLTIQP